ncbi:MAG TPA: divergent polysaccharide deacetylase family protein [Candidatus Acidoferrum sp.]|nr:divergent polysaccharide deacetylase family protein [Candidatus Acidoferrum sp.]
MGRKNAGTARKLLFLLMVCAAGVVVWMGGCDKIASKFRSKLKTQPAKKEHVNRRAPSAVVAGPKLAILLDDLGNDREAADAVFALHYPITISVLPFHTHSTEIADEAQRRGLEVMLHLPMRAIANETPEAHQLETGMRGEEVARALNGMLESVPTADGVNNHEGSLATTDAKLMAELMPLLKQKNLFFVDSRTTAATVAFDAAERAGVKSGFRNVPFLDDVQDVGAIKKQLEMAIRGAKEKGAAIAIGHPHPETLRALKEELPRAGAEGVHLVFVSEVVK